MGNVYAFTDFQCMDAPQVIFREATKAIGSLVGDPVGGLWSLFQGCLFCHLQSLTHWSPFTSVTISKLTSAATYFPHSCPSAPKDLRQHITIKTWPPMSCHSLQLGSHQCLTSLLSISPWQVSKRAVLNYFFLLSPHSPTC